MAYAEIGARRFVIGIAYVPPKVVELLRATLGADVELVEATRIRTDPSLGLDLALVGRAPGRLLDQLSAAGCPVVVIADTRDDSAEYRAIEHGASGYLVLNTPPATLRRIIRAALAGEPVFRRSVLGRWLRVQIGGPSDRAAGGHGGLTPRQQQILGLIAQGATTKEIAGKLRIKSSTVDKHISNLLKRVGVPNRAAAIGALGWSAVQSGASRPRALALEEDHEEEREEQPTSAG